MLTFARRHARHLTRGSHRLGRPLVDGKLARIWWIVLLRAAGAIAFGGLSIAWPRHSAVVLVGLFGTYAIIDGIMTLAMAARGRGLRAHAWLALAGAISTAAGLVAFELPRFMALTLVRVLGVWLIARGFAEILGEASVREDPEVRDWTVILNGSMSAIFGVGLTVAPRIGGLGLMWAVGLWAILHGLFMISFAFRLRRSDPFL